MAEAPRAWLVRAGRHGERESLTLEKNLVLIGWEELDDLSTVTTREQLLDVLHNTYPDAGSGRIANWGGQLWAFLSRVQPGDLAVLPFKHAPMIAIGRVTGPYTYRPDLPVDARHVRPVKWLRTDIPRTAVGQDLLYSLEAFLTVCEVRRNRPCLNTDRVHHQMSQIQAPAQLGRCDARHPVPSSGSEGRIHSHPTITGKPDRVLLVTCRRQMASEL
jgi:predicted Mrr-cat superfamily restriction endonuclease